MDVLRLLQTIGICVGALALVAIAVMMFFVLISFVPPSVEEDNIISVLNTHLENAPSPRRSRRKKERADDGEK